MYENQERWQLWIKSATGWRCEGFFADYHEAVKHLKSVGDAEVATVAQVRVVGVTL